MKLIALLVALGLERLATHLFHLRELRWLDGLFDPCLALVARLRPVPGWITVSGVIALFVLPVLLVWIKLGDALFGLPYIAFSVVVLFFSLGPQDIFEEVANWCSAVESGDSERAQRLRNALLECNPRVNSRMDEAIFAQANNRIFAVVFWFIVFGPVGAWTVRVADLVRRRAVFRSRRNSDTVNDRRADDAIPPVGEDSDAAVAAAASDLVHSLLAWIPARLAALSYLLAGSFDNGREAWAVPPSAELPDGVGEGNEQLLERVGSAALGFSPREAESNDEQQVRNARDAGGLVFRALVFWAVAVAALTLFSSAV